MDRPIDYELWRRAAAVLGRPRAVTLWTCPRCAEETLIWSGRQGDGAKCLNRKCGLDYQDFAELVEGHEAYLAARHQEATREVMESHDTYRRVRGRVRQVRHA